MVLKIRTSLSGLISIKLRIILDTDGDMMAILDGDMIMLYTVTGNIYGYDRCLHF